MAAVPFRHIEFDFRRGGLGNSRRCLGFVTWPIFFVLCANVTEMTSPEVSCERDRSAVKDSEKNNPLGPLGKARKSLKAVNAQILAGGYTKGLC